MPAAGRPPWRIGPSVADRRLIHPGVSAWARLQSKRAPATSSARSSRADLRGRPARRRRHPLPARAERLPAHRPRQGDLPQLRHRRRSSAAAATCASTTPTRTRRSRSTSRRSRPTCAGSASTGASSSIYASDYFEQLYDWAVASDPATARPTSTTRRRGDPRARGTLTKPGRDSPYRDRSVEENLDLFARMRAGEFADGARVLRAKIDMASRQHQAARPGDLPHPARGHHRTGDEWCDLPDLRLRARPVRRDRGHDALAVHAGVRQPPAALRLVGREAPGALAARARPSSRASSSPTR